MVTSSSGNHKVLCEMRVAMEESHCRNQTLQVIVLDIQHKKWDDSEHDNIEALDH